MGEKPRQKKKNRRRKLEMGNRIPRKFNIIECKMKIDTNAGNKDDVFDVYKTEDDYISYYGINKRTGKKYCMPVSLIRNENVIDIIKIIK